MGRLTSAASYAAYTSAALLLATSGCERADSSARATGKSRPARAPLTMESYCKPNGCRDYAAAVAHVRAQATPGKGPGCSDASIGRCSAYRYIHFSDGFSGSTEYFDDAGAMVGARTSADIDPGGSNVGTVPACAPEPSEVLCEHGGYVDAGRR